MFGTGNGLMSEKCKHSRYVCKALLSVHHFVPCMFCHIHHQFYPIYAEAVRIAAQAGVVRRDILWNVVRVGLYGLYVCTCFSECTWFPNLDMEHLDKSAG